MKSFKKNKLNRITETLTVRLRNTQLIDALQF